MGKKGPKWPPNYGFWDGLKNFIRFSSKKTKMKTIIVTDISPNSPISGKLLVLVLCAKMLLANQIAGFSNEVSNKVYFWYADKYRSFYKFILSFWVCAALYAQSNQKKKFAYL